jgi:hypothetical protein
MKTKFLMIGSSTGITTTRNLQEKKTKIEEKIFGIGGLGPQSYR